MNKIVIVKTTPIYPPNLLGIGRRIGYAKKKKKYSSEICEENYGVIPILIERISTNKCIN